MSEVSIRTTNRELKSSSAKTYFFPLVAEKPPLLPRTRQSCSWWENLSRVLQWRSIGEQSFYNNKWGRETHKLLRKSIICYPCMLVILLRSIETLHPKILCPKSPLSIRLNLNFAICVTKHSERKIEKTALRYSRCTFHNELLIKISSKKIWEQIYTRLVWRSS